SPQPLRPDANEACALTAGALRGRLELGRASRAPHSLAEVPPAARTPPAPDLARGDVLPCGRPPLPRMPVALAGDTRTRAKLVQVRKVELPVGDAVDAVGEVEPGRSTLPRPGSGPAALSPRRTVGNLSRASHARSRLGQ